MSSESPIILRTEELAPSSDDGGLLKEVFAEGSGELPSSGFEVTAHYTGRLLDGSVFDSSVERGTPFKFTLGTGGVIKGWDQGFATMRKGEKAFLTCGPGYAYGARGSPPKIPADATLRFEVELLNFGPKKKESWEMSAEEKIAEAEKAKAGGNAAIAGGDLDSAIDFYEEGWKLVEWETPEEGDAGASLRALKTALRSNAAMAHLKKKVSVKLTLSRELKSNLLASRPPFVPNTELVFGTHVRPRCSQNLALGC
jgi:peptidylprolyl isomerase